MNISFKVKAIIALLDNLLPYNIVGFSLIIFISILINEIFENNNFVVFMKQDKQDNHEIIMVEKVSFIYQINHNIIILTLIVTIMQTLIVMLKLIAMLMSIAI